MTDNTNAQAVEDIPSPNPDLRSLDKLIGIWRVSGDGIEGQVIYEWMEGGFFLIQHVDLIHGGRKIRGMEIIGHERPFGAEPSEEIKSRFYDSSGDTLDYVYEMEGNTLTIWGGQKGSPAYYRGQLSEDGKILDGGWVYPGGGGYRATSTRIK